jgi:hypothetical protein
MAAVLLVGCGSSPGPGGGGSPATQTQAPTASSAFSGVRRAYDTPVLADGRPLTFFMGAEY